MVGEWFHQALALMPGSITTWHMRLWWELWNHDYQFVRDLHIYTRTSILKKCEIMDTISLHTVHETLYHYFPTVFYCFTSLHTISFPPLSFFFSSGSESIIRHNNSFVLSFLPCINYTAVFLSRLHGSAAWLHRCSPLTGPGRWCCVDVSLCVLLGFAWWRTKPASVDRALDRFRHRIQEGLPLFLLPPYPGLTTLFMTAKQPARPE